MGDGGVDVAFTDVLYGVVVANAIYHLSFGLTLRNLMLVFALAVILGDWVEYKLSAQAVPATPRAHVTAFVLDVIILITWYLLTIVSTSNLPRFFAILIAFFALQAIWDALLLDLGPVALARRGHANLVAVYAVFGAAATALLYYRAELLLLGLGIYLVRKYFVWRNLIQEYPEAATDVL